MSWGPRGYGQTVSWRQVSITASPLWTSSYCQVRVPDLPFSPGGEEQSLVLSSAGPAAGGIDGEAPSTSAAQEMVHKIH